MPTTTKHDLRLALDRLEMAHERLTAASLTLEKYTTLEIEARDISHCIHTLEVVIDKITEALQKETHHRTD